MEITKKKDMVNHPEHYIHGGIETIDVIKAFTEDLTGIEAVDTANIIKYISRWKSKNGLEDLQKAQWYLNHLINEVSFKQNELIINQADGLLHEFAMPKPVMPKANPEAPIDDREVFFDDGVHQPLPEEIVKSRSIDAIADSLKGAKVICVSYTSGLEVGKVYTAKQFEFDVRYMSSYLELEEKPGEWFKLNRFELVIEEEKGE